MRHGDKPPIISIHALHEESDRRRAGIEHISLGISIHALHEESDLVDPPMAAGRANFNPRSP